MAANAAKGSVTPRWVNLCEAARPDWVNLIDLNDLDR